MLQDLYSITFLNWATDLIAFCSPKCSWNWIRNRLIFPFASQHWESLWTCWVPKFLNQSFRPHFLDRRMCGQMAAKQWCQRFIIIPKIHVGVHINGACSAVLLWRKYDKPSGFCRALFSEKPIGTLLNSRSECTWWSCKHQKRVSKGCEARPVHGRQLQLRGRTTNPGCKGQRWLVPSRFHVV